MRVWSPAAPASSARTSPGRSHAGHDVACSTRCCPRPPPGRAPVPGPGADFVRADVRDGPAVDGRCAVWTRSATRRRWSGSASTWTTRRDYAGCNDLGTAVLLAAMARAGVGRLVLASSMVVYGEGRYACAEHGAVAPGAAPARRPGGGPVRAAVPALRRAALTGPGGRGRAARPAQRLRGDEGGAGASGRPRGPARPGGTVALRYHNVYGPRMPRDTPYAGRRRDLPLRPGGRPGAAGLRGRRPAARLRPRPRRRRGQRGRSLDRWASQAARALARRAYNVGSGTPRTVGELAPGWPPPTAGRPRGHRRIPARRRAPRHRGQRAAARELGWRPTCRSPTASQSSRRRRPGGCPSDRGRLTGRRAAASRSGSRARRCDAHVPLACAHDAADDRQAKPGAAAGAGLRASVPRQARSKTRGRSAAGMPPQPSVTVSTRVLAFRPRLDLHRSRPGGVWRMALVSRLVSARDSSRGSTRTTGPAARPPAGRRACAPAGRRRRAPRRPGRPAGSATGRQLQRPGLDPRQLEQVVDHARQPLGPLP